MLSFSEYFHFFNDEEVKRCFDKGTFSCEERVIFNGSGDSLLRIVIALW